jgi:hypothetical protein
MNKYKAQRTGDFPSRLEAAVYQLLYLRQKAGEISDIQRQVRCELTDAAIATKIDFSFIEVASGQTIYAEAKGCVTDRWNLLKRLWAHYGPGKLEIWGGTYARPKLVDVIIPKWEKWKWEK